MKYWLNIRVKRNKEQKPRADSLTNYPQNLRMKFLGYKKKLQIFYRKIARYPSSPVESPAKLVSAGSLKREHVEQ